jgi:chromosome partitioning protein
LQHALQELQIGGISRGGAMLEPESAVKSASARVVVLGNEKGGSGKSTIAMQVAVALMNCGQRVATFDLDSRQRTLTRYIDNRRDWAKRAQLDLRTPTHFCMVRAMTLKLDENEAIEAAQLADAVASIESTHDFIVIDTPGADTPLVRLAHSLADTLVTPLNDSFVDLDVLGSVDAVRCEVVDEGPYAEMVRAARRRRRRLDGERLDWAVVRNRISAGARHRDLVAQGLEQLAARIGFRCIDGLTERPIHRELFPRGLSVLDQVFAAPRAAYPGPAGPEGIDIEPPADAAAQWEIMRMIEGLQLPLDARGQRRAAVRQAWLAAQASPLEVHDLIEP